jgi:hypothetical protein
MLETILYEGKEYPVRWIDIYKGEINDFSLCDAETLLIATEMLSNKLLNDDGTACVSDEATWIDSQIFFYVPDEIIFLSRNEIIAEMRKSLP